MKNIKLKVIEKRAVDGRTWWCVVRDDINKVVSKHKLKRDAIYYRDNPVCPI